MDFDPLCRFLYFCGQSVVNVIMIGRFYARDVIGRVSRFGACESDDVSAVKLIVIGPIRSEYTTPAGYYSLLARYL